MLIDKDALYEKTAEWEASAIAYVEELNRTPFDEMDKCQKAEWYRWTAILGERSAFKHDVADAPTIDIVRCKDCRRWVPIAEDHWGFCRGEQREQDWFCADGERKMDESEEEENGVQPES